MENAIKVMYFGLDITLSFTLQQDKDHHMGRVI